MLGLARHSEDPVTAPPIPTAASRGDTARPFGFIADPRAWLFCLSVLALTLSIGIGYHVILWTCVDDAGLSCVSHKTPYWDFLNLWQGGRLALSGRVEVLFDPEAWRALLRASHGAALPDSEWSYPPTMLLVGAPLSLLPLHMAYWVFTLGSVAALFAALLSLRAAPVWLCALACLTPLVVQNALFGQNGAFTTALLVGALGLAPRRPLIAGLMAGLLTVKPHLGVLIPFAWLAAGYWRAGFTAAATAGLMALASILAFGPEVWTGFREVTTPLMVAILEAPFPQPYHTQAFTVFVAARALGADLALAYGAQLAAAAVAIAVTFGIWRPAAPLRHGERVVVTALLALLVTPYGYSYDAIMVTVALLWFSWTLKPPAPILALLWLLMAATYFIHVFNVEGYPFFVLAPAGLAAWAIRAARRRAAAIRQQA